MKRQGIPDIKTAEEYFELAKHYARARERHRQLGQKSAIHDGAKLPSASQECSRIGALREGGPARTYRDREVRPPQLATYFSPSVVGPSRPECELVQSQLLSHGGSRP